MFRATFPAFLGHTISTGGIIPSQGKVLIKDFPNRTTEKQLCKH